MKKSSGKNSRKKLLLAAVVLVTLGFSAMGAFFLFNQSNHPAISLTKVVSNAKITSCSNATYTFNVTNIGDVALTINLVDDVLGTIYSGHVLAAGASETTVVSHMLTTNSTNIATATGVDKKNTSVHAHASAFVYVLPYINGSTNDSTHAYPTKILNKSIPSGYVMGLPVDAGLIHGMNIIFIKNPNQKVSIRFTAKIGGTVEMLSFDAFSYTGQATVRVGIQDDKNGTPSGQWLKENSFGTVSLSSSSGFKTVKIGTTVNVAKGQVYHIVFEAANDPLNGTVAIITYQGNGFAQPLNPDDPDIIWNDTEMGTLFNNGDGWQVQGRWPLFVVGYSDGSLEGQPYSLSAPWVVWGPTYVGQMLIPASDYNVSKIAFTVSIGSSGVTQDRLLYQIRNSNNTVLADGVFVEQGQLTKSQTWVEVTLPTIVNMKSGQLYRIIALSPQSELSNAYRLYGHEFCYNSTIGYGSLQHQLTSSLDNGTTWGENPDADAIFRITSG